jgi:YHS domain-containing protein
VLGRLLEILPAILLLILLARAVWRAFGHGQGGTWRPGQAGSRDGTPQHGERMVRDPVCGTFVLPSRAVSAGSGGGMQYFCSEQCRATYQRQPQAKEN